MKVDEEVKVNEASEVIEEIEVNEEIEVIEANEEIDANEEAEEKSEAKVKKPFKLDKELLNKLAFFISVGGAFVVGLLFSVLGDLTLKAASYWLIGGILLAFGGGACMVLSETFREKPTVKWVLKGVALAAAVALIGYFVGCQINLLEVNQAKPAIRDAVVPVIITLIVLDALTVAVETCHIVFTAVFKEE